MAIFKSVALMGSHWKEILDLIDASPADRSKTLAGLIREQLDGSIKVTANSKTVSFRAPKGGDLRNSSLLK